MHQTYFSHGEWKRGYISVLTYFEIQLSDVIFFYFGLNPTVGGSSLFGSRHFRSQKLWHFQKNVRSWVESEWHCLWTADISNVNFTNKNIYKARARVPKHGVGNVCPDSSNGQSILHESEGWGPTTSRVGHFLSKKINTFNNIWSSV